MEAALTRIGHQTLGRLPACAMQHASGLAEGVAGYVEAWRKQDADRSGQDARKPHFPNQKRTRVPDDRFGFNRERNAAFHMPTVQWRFCMELMLMVCFL